MRAADIQSTFPAILIAMLIDGTSRALFGEQRNEQIVFWVMVLSIGLSFWVQYARTVRGLTIVEKNKDYVLAAPADRPPPGHDPVPSRITQRGRTSAGDRHDQPRARDHHRGDAVVSRARPALDPALPRHLIQIGQKYLFAGEWWIAIFPGITLAALVLAVNLLGDWLRDASTHLVNAPSRRRSPLFPPVTTPRAGHNFAPIGVRRTSGGAYAF